MRAVGSWMLVAAACGGEVPAKDAPDRDTDAPIVDSDDGSGTEDSGGAPPDDRAGNRPPVANVVLPAGDVFDWSQVPLDGSASSDPDGDPLSFAWRLDRAPAGSTTAVNNDRAPIADIPLDVAGRYEVVLTVSDGILTDTDVWAIEVFPRP